ncbi:MAG: hypothetical protein IH959_01045 [Chloroflexi bacterium]|nr:hypothetical protein [Chloroflexota bacterium]
MYEPPRQDERLGCRETWLLTRATFGLLLPFVFVLIGVLIALVAAVSLLTVHPLLALVPIVVVVAALYLVLRGERSRPPDA